MRGSKRQLHKVFMKVLRSIKEGYGTNYLDFCERYFLFDDGCYNDWKHFLETSAREVNFKLNLDVLIEGENAEDPHRWLPSQKFAPLADDLEKLLLKIENKFTKDEELERNIKCTEKFLKGVRSAVEKGEPIVFTTINQARQERPRKATVA